MQDWELELHLTKEDNLLREIVKLKEYNRILNDTIYSIMSRTKVAEIIVKAANYHQIPIEDVFKWIKDEIVDIHNQYCFHYEVKSNEDKGGLL